MLWQKWLRSVLRHNPKASTEMASTSAPVTEDKAKSQETKHRVDALAELRKTVARLDARTAALHRDIAALSLFVRNTQVVHTELMTRLCDQVFRISDILHLLPVVNVNAPLPNDDDDDEEDNVIEDDDGNDNDDKEEEGGLPQEDVYQRDHIL